MDRRQRKTKEAILNAFSDLLSQKQYHQITVGDIITAADIGRATFYAHFETKDALLKEFCQELFCHIFDTLDPSSAPHKHIFDCNGSASPFLHLFEHIRNNDRQLLSLSSSYNNDLFLSAFKSGLIQLLDHLPLSDLRRDSRLPDSFWKNHVASTFVETLRWWIQNGMQESPEQLADYFHRVV